MPINKEKMSKWQEASNVVNNYRWNLSSLLKSFTDEERTTQNYKDLIKEVKEASCKAVRDVSPEDAEDCFPEDSNYAEEKINWKSKYTWVLLLGSPVLVELLKYIPDIIALFTGGGQTPKGN
jgi:hypothetical protein